MKRNITFLAKATFPALFITMICIACGKSVPNKTDDDSPIVNNDCKEEVFYKGWGTCSYDKPEGTPLQLPQGLTFLAAVQPRTNSETDSCGFKFEEHPHSWDVGFSVILCVTFKNSTNKPLKLILPPGLIFVSRDPFGQNGILMQRVVVQVPANSIAYNQLNMHCINGSKRVSARVELPYDLGPVTNVKPALELADFLDNKDLKLASNLVKGAIGTACNDITDTGKIKDSTWAVLKTFK